MNILLVLFYICIPFFIACFSVQANDISDTSVRMTLEQAVEIGLRGNSELRKMRSRNEFLNQEMKEKYRDFFPKAGLEFNRSRNVNVSAQDTMSNEIKLNVSQVVYDGGLRRRSLEISRLNLALLKADYWIQYNSLRLEIQKQFYKLLAQKGSIALSEKSLARAGDVLQKIRLEEKSGFATRHNVLTSAAKYREIESNLLLSRREYQSSITAFKLFIHSDPGLDFIPEGDLLSDYFLLPPSVRLPHLLATVRAGKPELKRTLGEIRRLQRELQIAENSWIPKLTLSAYAGRRGDHLPVRERIWGMNFDLSFPVGSSSFSTSGGTSVGSEGESKGGSLSTRTSFLSDFGYERRVKEARANLSEAVLGHKEALNRAEAEVSAGYSALKDSWEAIRIGNGRIYFQTENIRIMNARFTSGEILKNDILESELELMKANEYMIQSVLSYLNAVSDLEFLLGMNSGSLGFVKKIPGRGNLILSVKKALPEYKIFSQGDFLQEKDSPSKNINLNDNEYLMDTIQIDGENQ